MARSLNSQMVFEYIQECFRAAYKYFAVPQRRRRGEEGERTGRQEEEEESDSHEEDGLDPTVDGNKAPSSDLLDREEEEEEDLLYVFDKMIFTRGKVNIYIYCVTSPPEVNFIKSLTCFFIPASDGGVQHLQTGRPPEGRVSRRLQEDRAEASAADERALQEHSGRALPAVLLYAPFIPFFYNTLVLNGLHTMLSFITIISVTIYRPAEFVVA